MHLKLIPGFLLFLLPLFLVGEEKPVSEEEKLILEKEELQVQDTFPQYRVNFYHKSVQKEVYNEFLQELKEKEKIRMIFYLRQVLFKYILSSSFLFLSGRSFLASGSVVPSAG